MTSKRIAALAVATIAATSAIAASTLPAKDDVIASSTTTTYSYPNISDSIYKITVEKTWVDDQGVNRYDNDQCSGALITSDKILTAGHCFTRLGTGAYITTPQGENVHAKQVIPHPDEDIALMVLDKPVDSPVVPVTTQQLLPDDELQHYGYYKSGEHPKSSWVKYQAEDNVKPEHTINPQNGVAYGARHDSRFLAKAGESFGSGDSGGVFSRDGKVIGVLSAIENYEGNNTHEYHVWGTSTHNIKQWLVDNNVIIN